MNEARRKDFIDLIRNASPPLFSSGAPELKADLAALVYPGVKSPLRGIRAVLFDIYGTLFTSAAGDIGVDGGYRREALDALAREYVPGCGGEALTAYFREEVLQTHARLYPRTPYPEVRVEAIWASLFKGPLSRYAAAGMDTEEFALRYELAVNPVFPKPGIRALFEKLKELRMILGIISNAQFFTPLLFEVFFEKSPEALGLDPRLLIYSFEAGEAKPSPVLFKTAADRLRSRGISPDTVLFVGNDMLKDIYGAASGGFKTALFAGDGRSLRLREGDPLTEKLLPDGIIRCLSDIPAMIG
ncbi:MAG: HAD family hydrolase [Spirochaetaceae bacterium]|jgi:putative hydrolase of the HAD superfamily|nr:HAD family hydrolase [Spirochaetaceae bacterium]